MRLRLAIVSTLALAILMPALANAQVFEGRPRHRDVVHTPPQPGLWQKNLAGGQLGPWFTSGFGEDIVTPDYRLSAPSTAFHLEFYYMPHLTGTLNLDLNIGAVGRGDIRLSQSTSTSGVSGVGSATLYPVGVGLAWFPLAKSTQTAFQPCIRGGGSLIIGTEQVEATLYDYYGQYLGYSSESRVNLGFYGGGQIYWVLGTQFALSAGAKYQYASFSKELFGVKDYSGVQVLFGAAYLYH